MIDVPSHVAAPAAAYAIRLDGATASASATRAAAATSPARERELTRAVSAMPRHLPAYRGPLRRVRLAGDPTFAPGRDGINGSFVPGGQAVPRRGRGFMAW